MRRILAIAGLAVRAAIRSRLVICLLVLLLAIIIGLPLVVQGDGTPEGHVRITIGYTMGLASLVLSLTALWAGALSISREVADKQIQMLCSKPVHRIEIWFGKWLGLTAVHVALLGLSALASYVTLYRAIHSDRFTDEQRHHLQTDVLTARRPLHPPPPDVERAARAELQQRMERGLLPEGMDPAATLQNLRQEMLMQALAIPPGGQLAWTFPLPPDLDPAAGLRLSFRFSTSRLGIQPARGTWLAGPPQGAPLFRITATNNPGSVHTLELPAASAAGGSALVVRYINDDPEPFTLLFAARDGLVLHIPAGGFAANFSRAVALTAFRLALLVAIGLTAGTLFSTPVAAFMALAGMIVLQLGGYVGSLARQEQLTPWSLLGGAEPGPTDAVMRMLFRLLDQLLAPLQTGRPLDDAALGILVDPAVVAQAGIVHLVIYGGLLALLAGACFNRRELALPTS